MGNDKQPEPVKGKCGLPQLSAMHVVIIIGVIVVAVIFFAKFGSDTDAISPSSGEMAILKKPVTPVQQVDRTPDVRPTISFKPPECGRLQTRCGSICVETYRDLENCGSCGTVCPAYPNMTRECYAGSCVPPQCNTGFSDCNKNPADGCEINTLADSDNCGTCGNACPSSSHCLVYKCVSNEGALGDTLNNVGALDQGIIK